MSTNDQRDYAFWDGERLIERIHELEARLTELKDEAAIDIQVEAERRFHLEARVKELEAECLRRGEYINDLTGDDDYRREGKLNVGLRGEDSG